MKRKLTAVLLAASLLLTGCAGSTDSKSKDSSKENTTKTTVETDAAEDGTSAESSTAAGTADADEIPSANQQVFAMDTYMSVTCYGEKAEEACQAAIDEINRLDEMLSVGNPDGVIGKINAEGSGTLTEEANIMAAEAMWVYETTDGAFDMTVYPLMELWGFATGDFRVPEQSEIDNCLQYMGSDKLTYDEDTGEITLGENQGIDLGGIAKGYTSSRLMEIFEEYGLVSGLVSLGGNVQVYRTKTDGSKWKCGIQDPNHPDEDALLGILKAEDIAIITSGAYERNFTDEATGVTYHHILDPKTGYSAENGLISATVVSADGTLADTLSTACYVMGLDKSLEYWKTYGAEKNFDLILMTDDNKVYATSGIADDFTSDYEVNVVNEEE